jgi:hypothetical protein
MRQNEGTLANASFYCFLWCRRRCNKTVQQEWPPMLFGYAVQCLTWNDINTRAKEHSYIQKCYSPDSKHSITNCTEKISSSEINKCWTNQESLCLSYPQGLAASLSLQSDECRKHFQTPLFKVHFDITLQYPTQSYRFKFSIETFIHILHFIFPPYIPSTNTIYPRWFYCLSNFLWNQIALK